MRDIFLMLFGPQSALQIYVVISVVSNDKSSFGRVCVWGGV